MTTFIIIASLILILNVWATRSVLKNNDEPHRKTMLVIAIWLVPLIASLQIVLDRVSELFKSKYREKKQSEPLPTGFVLESRPAELFSQEVPAFQLLQNMGAVNGIPLVDWKALGAWSMSVGNPDMQREAFESGKRAWLLYLRDFLCTNARLYESDCTYLLSSLEGRMAIATADYVATTKSRISKLMGGVAHFPPGEKSVLVVFDDADAYYKYVSCYYPDQGEFAFSGGMFINSGCPHFVTKRADLVALEPIIVHEMMHSAVSYLKLPTWLDEGIAVNTERRFAGACGLIYTPQELRDMHRAFWSVSNIQEFWSGKSFLRADDGNLLSYDLARILVEQMSTNWSAFIKFVLNAQRGDAGDAPAQEFLEIDLGAYVSALLKKEQGPLWAPCPSAWSEASDA